MVLFFVINYADFVCSFESTRSRCFPQTGTLRAGRCSAFPTKCARLFCPRIPMISDSTITRFFTVCTLQFCSSIPPVNLLLFVVVSLLLFPNKHFTTPFSCQITNETINNIHQYATQVTSTFLILTPIMISG